ATDVCGNTASCLQRITFSDATSPVITSCPSGGFLGYNPANEPTCASVTAQVHATDNCGATHFDCQQSDGATACTHTRTFTITAVDGCRNASAPCTVTYTWVVDTDGPTFSYCPQNQNLGCNPATLPTCD